MAEKKYVAYVGTYTHGSSKGIHIYDLDVENGNMTERKSKQTSSESKNGTITSSLTQRMNLQSWAHSQTLDLPLYMSFAISTIKKAKQLKYLH